MSHNMKHILLVAFIFILSKAAFGLEDPLKQAEKRSLEHFSHSSGDDMTQIFLDILKSLGDQHVENKITRDEYSSKISQLREALLAKKRSEELDIGLIRNSIIQDPKQSAGNDMISRLDKMLNILDKLDAIVSKNYPRTTTQDILTKVQKALALKENGSTRSVSRVLDNNREALTTREGATGGPRGSAHLDRPRRPTKHQTERDLSKYQDDQGRTRCLNPELYGEGCEADLNNDPNAEYDQDVNSGKPSGEDEQNAKGGKRSRGHSGQKLHPNEKSSSGKRLHNNDDLGNDTSDPDLAAPLQPLHHLESTGDSVIDSLIMVMIAIVTTQLCLVCFLVAFKDKFIASLTLKYGQIKVTW